MIGSYIDTMANIEYGVMIALAIDVIVLIAVAMMRSRAKLGVLSYLVALVLLAPLTFQMSRLVGACNITSQTSDLAEIVGAFSPTIGRYVSSAADAIAGDEIKWLIFRRVMWSLLFILIGGFGIYITMVPKRRRGLGAFEDYDSNVSSSTGDWGF